MLSPEQNELLTRVGPGTPMGEYLSEYWVPACRSAKLEADGAPERAQGMLLRSPSRIRAARIGKRSTRSISPLSRSPESSGLRRRGVRTPR